MSKNLIHLVSAVKYRRQVDQEIGAFIEQDTARVLSQYMGIDPIAIAFDQNHIHVLFDLPRTQTLESVARRLKASVSKHARAKFPQLLDEVKPDAFWQKRFLYKSLGSLGESQTRKYIEKQQAFSSRLEH